MTARARTAPQRLRDTLARFEAVCADAWVATASPAGVAHLIPLTYSWDGECLVLSVPAGSVTDRNIRSCGRARLGFGATRDVVIVDADLEGRLDVDAEEGQDTAAAYAEQANWDPRRETDPYVFIRLRPRRVQAWRELNELSGKLLMRDGEWRSSA